MVWEVKIGIYSLMSKLGYFSKKKKQGWGEDWIGNQPGLLYY